MQRVAEVAELRAALAAARAEGARVGLVPTMGALHAGHLALVDAARAECDAVVVSIFVNPLQFAPGEDFERYPRDLEGDLGKLADRGVRVVFTPSAATFTPPDQRTTVHVAGLGQVLEGASRPGHFDGVATIVTKLLNAVGPDRAYFGEKDFQQLVIIRTLVRDLALPVTVVGAPIVRDADGLALSSRNAYLSAEQRAQALALSAALGEAAEVWADPSRPADASATRARLRSRLEAAPGVRLDSAEVVDPETLEPLEGVVGGPAQALVAAYVGATRLIDNVRLEPPQGAARRPEGD